MKVDISAFTSGGGSTRPKTAVPFIPFGQAAAPGSSSEAEDNLLQLQLLLGQASREEIRELAAKLLAEPDGDRIIDVSETFSGAEDGFLEPLAAKGRKGNIFKKILDALKDAFRNKDGNPRRDRDVGRNENDEATDVEDPDDSDEFEIISITGMEPSEECSAEYAEVLAAAPCYCYGCISFRIEQDPETGCPTKLVCEGCNSSPLASQCV